MTPEAVCAELESLAELACEAQELACAAGAAKHAGDPRGPMGRMGYDGDRPPKTADGRIAHLLRELRGLLNGTIMELKYAE